jgi:2-dehydro-3-deoxyphosphogluconate aldolase/(4S)-4-hydroxy-2-oxoglutarate aldolase
VARPSRFRIGRQYSSVAARDAPGRQTDMALDVTHSRRATVTARVQALGIVAVIRLKDPAKLHAVVDAMTAGGVRALEVTMTVPGAVELIRELAPALPDGFLLGAGTVTDARTARAVIEAGASFVVSPVLRPEVIAACHERDVPAVPGCFSPTEILTAHECEADIVKVFPATALGPQFIRDVRAPMPQVKLMPTGGVTLDNAGDWIRAGAVAVGLGSALLDAKAIESGRYDVITANARRVVESVAAARRG